jgi:outer membrane autotransporter protein
LVASVSSAVSAPFDISGNVIVPQTLGPPAGETGNVQATGKLISAGTAVEIIGPGAILTNAGEIVGAIDGVSGTGVITGTTITNSGKIFGFNLGITFNAALGVGKITNQAGATISSNRIGIAVAAGSSLTGGVVNEAMGTISGNSAGMALSDGSTITGGIDNSGRIEGTAAGSFGIVVTSGSDINFANNAGLGAGIVNRAGGLILGDERGINVQSNSNISGGVVNQAGGTISGRTGIFIQNFGPFGAPGGRISGGIVNNGAIEGALGPAIQDGDRVLNVINSGTLMGGGGVAVSLLGGDDSLTLDTGSVLIGRAEGGNGVDALILKGMGAEDDDFLGFESLELNGTDWTLSGDVTLEVAAPPIPLAGPVAPLGGPAAGMAMVTAGTLRVNGKLTAPGGVKVAPGGTLGGTGEVVGMIDNMGTIAPGNSVGTLKVTGDVAFGAGSTLAVEVDGAGNVDLLDVMGDVTVDPAAVLGVTFLAGAPDVQGALFVTATGTVGAPFQIVNVTGGTGSNALVAGNSLVFTGAVTPGAGGPLGLTVVGPASVNTAAYAAVESGFSFQRAVAAEQRARRLGPDARLWARGIGDFVERDGEANNPSSQQDITGVAFGGDTPILADGLRLGLAGGYLTTDADATDGSGHEAEVASLQALAYGTFDLGPGGPLGAGTEVFFGAQGGYQDQDIDRAVNVGGTRMVGRGETSGYLLGGYLGVSHTVPIDANWAVRPGSQVSYLHQSQDGYRDSQGLSVANGVIFQPHGRVGWSEQVALDDREVGLSVAGAGADLDLEDGDEGTLTVGFGLDVIFTAGIRATLGFDGAYGAARNRSSAFAGVSIDLP